jgi:hypothetical protein
MRQVDLVLEAAQHLLGPFSRPFFGVKFLYDYGLRRGENKGTASQGISPEKVAFEEMSVRCEWASDWVNEVLRDLRLVPVPRPVRESGFMEATKPPSARTMDYITLKTPNPKCRLYWCLIGFLDWRYSQSCWYFRLALWTIAPITFSLVSYTPPPFPVWLIPPFNPTLSRL